MSKEDFQRALKPKKEPVVRFRFSMIVFIFIFTMGACFAMHMLDANINSNEFIAKIYSENSENSSQNSSQPDASSENSVSSDTINPVPLSSQADSTYWQDCAFIGDGILAQTAANAQAQDANILAQEGLTAADAASSDTISNTLTQIDFKNIYIMLGTSELASDSPEDTAGHVDSLIKSLKAGFPDAKIYILSVPPVTQYRENLASNAILNTTVDAYNSLLLSTANSESVYFVDVNTALKGNNGKLPDAFAAEDGISLKDSTYDTICDYILSHTAQ